MSLGDLLAILGFPPIVGVYYASLVVAVATATSSPDAALRDAERAAVYVTAGMVPVAIVAFFAALIIEGAS
jgi:hypothetical protein